MKRLSLTFKFWRAGYRAKRGTWWLLMLCLLGCCGTVLYGVLSQYLPHYHAIYSTLAYLHTDIHLSTGGQTRDELQPALQLLADSRCVDYYLLESRLDDTAAGALGSVSTVVTTRHSLYAVQSSDLLCDSEHGEPLDGYAYLNARYELEGRLTAAHGTAFDAGGQTFTYQAPIFGDDLFDMLVSEHDFAQCQKPIQRIIYGISPTASRAQVQRLNERLADLLPRARFDVVQDRSLGTRLLSALYESAPHYITLVPVCLVTYLLLCGYLLNCRMRDLTVTRLVGCRRGTLLWLLTGESVANALLAFCAEMAAFSLYRLIVAEESPRILLLLWEFALPVGGVLVLFAAAIGLLTGWHWLRRAPLTMEREATE